MWDYDDIDIGKLRNLESEGKFENILINILCLNSKQDNRCPCRVFIRKNTKLDKISTSGNMTPRMAENFVKYMKYDIRNTNIRSASRFFIRKNKIRQNNNHEKNYPPKRDPSTPKMLKSNL